MTVDEMVATLEKLKKEHGVDEVKMQCRGSSGAFHYIEPELYVTTWNPCYTEKFIAIGW